MDLKSYLSELSPDEREALATRCGTTAGHLRNISYGYRVCAEKLAIALERETNGRLRCELMRPDVDWKYLRTRGTSASTSGKNV